MEINQSKVTKCVSHDVNKSYIPSCVFLGTSKTEPRGNVK